MPQNRGLTTTNHLHAVGCTCCADLLSLRYDRRRFLTLGAAAGLTAALPAFAFAAEGNYEAMLLTCIDPRFPEPTIKYMQSRNMLGKYSQFTFAGASIGVVAPALKTWAPAFWDNLAASMQLHHIPKVIAMYHRDCGAAKIAYGAEAVKDKAIETATHKAALMEFKKQIAERQPKLQVELGLMALDGSVESFFVICRHRACPGDLLFRSSPRKRGPSADVHHRLSSIWSFGAGFPLSRE